jgi:putative MATE family efflux protein
VLTIDVLEHEDAGLAIGRIAVPGAFAFLGDQLLGIVDTIAIGTIGAGALAAIAAATSVYLVFAIGLFGFGSGLRIVGAQAIGAGRGDRFGTIVRSATLVPLAIAAALGLASVFGARPLMVAMLPPGLAPGPAIAYLVLRMSALIPFVLTSQLLSAFATAGDTKISIRVLAAINIVHIPLLCVLALGMGSHHPLGLAGAGLSSLVAECVGCAYAIFETTRRSEFQIFASTKIEATLVRATAALSWPDFIFLTLQVAPEPLAIGLIAPYGAQTVAALRALIVVSDLTWALPGPFSDACQTIIGQRLGARDLPGARAFLRSARAIAMRVGFTVAASVALLAWPLSALVTWSPALATLAYVPLAVYVALVLPLKALAMVNVSAIRAAGDTPWVLRMGIVTSVLSGGGIALGICVLHIGLWAFAFGFALGWIFRNIVTIRKLRSGDWERRGLGVV